MEDQTKALFCFQMLTEIYASLDRDHEGFDGWIDLYHILYSRCGFPVVTDDNAAAHQYLVPCSFAEMQKRILFMHLSLVRVRTTNENGQGRTAAFRHAATCTLPSGKPVGALSKQNEEPQSQYFEKLLGSGSGEHPGPTTLVLMEQLMRGVETTVCLPHLSEPSALWHRGVTKMLLAKSRQDLLASDQAAPKELSQVLSEVLRGLVGHPHEVNHLAHKKMDEEGSTAGPLPDPASPVAKPLEVHLKQVMWLGCSIFLEFREWALLKKLLGVETSKFIEACLHHDGISKYWNLRPEEDEKVQALEKLKKECTGCKTLQPHMVTERFGGEEKITDANCKSEANRIISGEDWKALLFLLFHRNNQKTNFNRLLGTAKNASGNPVVPPAFVLVAQLTGHFVCDQASAKIAHSFVNNNGQRLIDPPSFATLGEEDGNTVPSKVRHIDTAALLSFVASTVLMR